MSQLKGGEIGEELTEFFDRLIDTARDSTGKLTTWEQDFITDIGNRFEAYRERFTCSAKQWEIISRIGRKLGVEP